MITLYRIYCLFWRKNFFYYSSLKICLLLFFIKLCSKLCQLYWKFNSYWIYAAVKIFLRTVCWLLLFHVWNGNVFAEMSKWTERMTSINKTVKILSFGHCMCSRSALLNIYEGCKYCVNLFLTNYNICYISSDCLIRIFILEIFEERFWKNSFH
jgi:hypothetical protein